MKGKSPAADLSDDLLNRYSRHILLPEIGIEGQQKIGGARFFVVGAGGLGSPAALYLAAAGAGAIVVCDHDRVDLTNLQRQILHDDSQIGARKVDSAARALRRANPHIEIVRVARAIDDDNADELLRGVDVVIDGSDNFAARHAVNRAAARARAPLVSGAATGFDGQLAVFDLRAPDSPCYRCLFDEADVAPQTPCAVMGVFAPLAGVVGAMQAASALRLVIGIEPPAPRLLLLDFLRARWREINLSQDPACPVCRARAAR